MPIKIFAAPGDHRNDFEAVETQTNTWLAETNPRVLSIHPLVNQMPSSRDSNQFMMTMVVHYDKTDA